MEFLRIFENCYNIKSIKKVIITNDYTNIYFYGRKTPKRFKNHTIKEFAKRQRR